jgi:hypothetical protein
MTTCSENSYPCPHCQGYLDLSEHLQGRLIHVGQKVAMFQPTSNDHPTENIIERAILEDRPDKESP